MAIVSHRSRAPRLPNVRLGAVSKGQPGICPRRGRRINGARSHRPRARLSLRPAAEDDTRSTPGGHDHLLLAHSLAESRSVRHLPLARGSARRHARQQYPRVPHPVSLQQLPRHRRPPAGSSGRPGDVYGLVSGPADCGKALPYFDRMATVPGVASQVGRGLPPGRAVALRSTARSSDRHRCGPARLHQGH